MLPDSFTLYKQFTIIYMNNPELKRFLSGLILVMILCTIQVRAQQIDSIRLAVDNLLKAGESGGLLIKSDDPEYRISLKTVDQYLDSARNFKNANYDSLGYYSKKAVTLSLQLTDLESISASVKLLGDFFMKKEDYTKSGECYLLCLKIEEKTQNKKRIADINYELGALYFQQEIFEKSLYYNMTALAEYEKEHDTLSTAKVYSHLGNLYSSREYCEQRTDEQKKEDFRIAVGYIERSIKLSIQVGHKPMEIIGYSNIASVYNKLEESEKALPYILKARDYFLEKKDFSTLTSTLHILGVTYFKLDRYSESTQSFQEALRISKNINALDGIHFLYESMAQTYYSAGDYKNANVYYIKYMTIKDSISNMQKMKELNELETKYQSEKKENEISKLTAQKREKNFMLYTLSGLLIFLCILGYFLVKNIRNKRLIAEQTVEIKEGQIKELENERQLIATKSVLKGEESERSRMARDLHDGLGGLLSGVKINLSSMKGNSIISNENVEVFDQAIKMLDSSIIELRRVAHSLMPETLNHYGLKTALNDFISDLNTNTAHVLSFRAFGEDVRYNSQLELTLYRIAQELVNNALKHSEAKNIDLHLIAEASRVCIQVVDNGKGFDVSNHTGDGQGLISIRDRVASNGGRFDLESTPGHGTEATVEFLLPLL